jgi:hypothetical protein
MVGHGAKLGRKQEQAIAALLTQPRVEDAARTVGVAVRTLYRWMRGPEFAARYKEARRAAFGQCTARLQQMSAAAASTLGKIMVDANAPAASRVRAASCILERAAQAIEIEEIEGRLDALESAAEDSQGNHG